jgi:dihydrofolate synthase/folylpolyglutamate synthase
LNYSDVIEYLFHAFPAYERNGNLAYKPGLETVFELSNALGAPHSKITTIHIAGTNGKGSSSHLLASILKEAGYKVGLYTSPHVYDFCERIQINGEKISQDEVVKFVTNHKSILEKFSASFFEITTVMAIDYFYQEKVDIAVIETGLGGRLDATNIITPIVSLITNIGMDHTQFLGNTLESIASEKAGIIKPKVPIVISQKQIETTKVFLSKAESCNSPIQFAEANWKVQNSFYVNGYLQVSILHLNSNETFTIDLGLLGAYQLKNIIGVLEVVDTLNQHKWAISKDAILKGCKQVMCNFPIIGRWQRMQSNPMVILEAAHNKDGIQTSMSQLIAFKKNKHLIVGFSSDKEVNELMPFLPKEAQYYVCKANSNRAMDLETLSEYFLQNQLQVRTFATVNKAIEEALMQASEEDVIWIGGSLYLLGDIDKKQFGWHEKN